MKNELDDILRPKKENNPQFTFRLKADQEEQLEALLKSVVRKYNYYAQQADSKIPKRNEILVKAILLGLQKLNETLPNPPKAIRGSSKK